MYPYSFTKDELIAFIDRAGKATYAGGGKEEKQPQNTGFIELIYKEENLSYRDSYTGYMRSWGIEVVRYKNKPVWLASYGGGMTEGYKTFPDECFEFLKKALNNRENGLMRGPELLRDGDWKHTYQQRGDVYEFSGYQKIYYKNKLAFFHRIIGGLVVNK